MTHLYGREILPIATREGLQGKKKTDSGFRFSTGTDDKPFHELRQEADVPTSHREVK